VDNALIRLQDVSKEYLMGGKVIRALRGVTLEVPRGVLAAVIGPSGSGKTTLLNLLGALDKPTSGQIAVDGLNLDQLDGRKAVEYRRRKVGFIFQDYNLLPKLTALENVMLPLLYARTPFKEARLKALQLLERVNMSHRTRHRPPKLSGGEQQRVAIARALANEPLLILADEPTGNLDTATGEQVITLLKDLVKGAVKTAIVVTHDERIGAIADMRMEIRDGSFVFRGSRTS
jgi:ABC-type lipoprotein export system ATPase subunit